MVDLSQVVGGGTRGGYCIVVFVFIFRFTCVFGLFSLMSSVPFFYVTRA